MDTYNKPYILSEKQCSITSVWIDGPYPNRDVTGAICINEKGSYQVYLTVDRKRTEENPRWLTYDGVPLYKWDGEQVIARTEEEIAADRAAIPAPPPSAQEQLRADVDFLAAMQGVSL